MEEKDPIYKIYNNKEIRHITKNKTKKFKIYIKKTSKCSWETQKKCEHIERWNQQYKDINSPLSLSIKMIQFQLKNQSFLS